MSSPVIGRAQGWRYAPPPPAASALTPSAHRSSWLSCGRREAPPGGLIADVPELGQPGEDAGGTLTGKPGHAFHDLGPSRELRVGFDLRGDRRVELPELGTHHLEDRGGGLGDMLGRTMLALLNELLLDLLQPAPPPHHPTHFPPPRTSSPLNLPSE